MLVKSSKSRFAAIAIMALGVSTFMGTSAALAEDVTVSGTVGECSTASTVTAAAVVAFGEVTKGTTGTQSLTPTVTQGKKTDCSARSSNVSAAISDLTGEAGTNAQGEKVVVAIGALNDGVYTMTAAVPAGASATESFGAKVTLTLSDNN